MTGSIPWPEVQQDPAVVFKVAVNNQRPDRPTCATQRCQTQPKCVCVIGDTALWEFIQRCWLFDPHERPTATQLCEELAKNPTIEPYKDGPEIKATRSLSLPDYSNMAQAH